MRFIIWLATTCVAMIAVNEAKKNVVCYFGSWSVYRPGAGKFEIEDIDAKMCTHVIYTFVGIDVDKIKILDPWQDLPDKGGKDGFKRFNALRNKNPALKTLVAIGGWNEKSKNYSTMAGNEILRKSFVKNAVDFVKKYNFNGFDVDWEYPAQRGGKPEDRNNFVILLKELRKAMDKENLLLTAAVGATKSAAIESYDIPEISKHLHFINLMAYDYHGAWEKVTGLNSPLNYEPYDSNDDKELTVRASVEYWLSKGAPAEKINLGIATYGRSFTLVDSNANAIGDPINGPGNAGPYTRAEGSLGYNEICEMVKNDPWVVKFDETRLVPFAYYSDQWVSYDNIRSVREKAKYINKMKLGGGMVWSLETDDFKGICGERYPLVRSLRYVLNKGN